MSRENLHWEMVSSEDRIKQEEPWIGDAEGNRAFVQDLCSKLEELGIKVTPESDSFEIAASHKIHAWILQALLPDRVLIFDREMVSSGRDYAILLYSFAHITGGDWKPESVRAAVDFAGSRAYVEFAVNSQIYAWDFEQQFDWVSVRFDEEIIEFSKRELPGDFIHIQTESQETGILYLPNNASAVIEHFLRGK
jgi:hypothetical protein